MSVFEKSAGVWAENRAQEGEEHPQGTWHVVQTKGLMGSASDLKGGVLGGGQR